MISQILVYSKSKLPKCISDDEISYLHEEYDIHITVPCIMCRQDMYVTNMTT